MTGVDIPALLGALDDLRRLGNVLAQLDGRLTGNPSREIGA